MILDGDERVRSQEGCSGDEVAGVAGVEEVEVMRIFEVRKVRESGWERQIDEVRQGWEWARGDGMRGEAKAGGMVGRVFPPRRASARRRKVFCSKIRPRQLSLGL